MKLGQDQTVYILPFYNLQSQWGGVNTTGNKFQEQNVPICRPKSTHVCNMCLVIHASSSNFQQGLYPIQLKTG